MATIYKHPGVYIEEVPSARSIQGASTSTAVFIGVTEIGTPQQPTLVTSWNAYVRQFGGLIWNGMASWAVYEFFNEGGTACYVVSVAQSNGNGKPATGTSGGITLTAVTPGTWGNSLGFVISNASGPDDKTSQVFNLSIVINQAAFDAIKAGSSAATLKAYVTGNNLQPQPIGGKAYYVLESFNGYTEASMSTALPNAINTNSMFVRAAVSGNSRPPNNAATLTNGTAVTWNFDAATQTLTTVQGISLLAIPDTVTASAGGDASGNPSPSQQATLINNALLFCDKPEMRNLFYACDPPFGQSVSDVMSFKDGSTTSPALNSTYGALYYPWVWIYNAISGTNVPIAPSGPTLGRYAYTDANVGVWKSPAGVNDGKLQSVVAVQTVITNSDQDQLNPDGINAIRNFIGYGNVIWGARTLAAAGSEWTYVSVRRLFIYVEQSLKQSLQWVVFEPNDQQTWAAVTRDITAFLTTLWQAGGLFGATAAEAFFVTCDASNNPPETRAQGQLYIDVGLAPVYPAEFVIIRMTQKVAGPDSGA
ncbi:phage tail protein [Burkholderia ubonensis]|uniref:Phage tail protein n=1 Tax=Burkholderia ubonensis TaxID=101571 RepID=A0A124U4Q1_9BURK|nr:phage tail sheath C-terminal domain-containing protein [Burkholderia ubonensis]KVH81814.1 phage tail protein [Burkholderia ubonensis]KVM17002.1 phage tail protein [Burkholderia ubonensis]KVM18810.1 phage tail protein [Burkholderia ubonensis]KVM42254.1 phage tail protein [Burkholderia ubonensis]KVN85796.1 phage tail protein [Burkholderia ubonensis]